MNEKTILIVDDSATDRHLLMRILEPYSFNLITASTGEEALSIAQSRKPDCVLMDVVMPVMNGFEATRHMKQHEGTQHIPVIMVSSKDETVDAVWAKKQGAIDYLTKPVVERKLVGAVIEVLN